jgi:hypothetical protein
MLAAGDSELIEWGMLNGAWVAEVRACCHYEPVEHGTVQLFWQEK